MMIPPIYGYKLFEILKRAIAEKSKKNNGKQ